MTDETPNSVAVLGSYVRANGINIYYEQRGSGTPLLLLHGGTGTCRWFDGQVAVLAEHFQVFTLDSRGHGKTDNPTGRLSYRAMGDDVAAFIQELQLEQPLLVGFSDGAQIALEIGIRYPQVAHALVLCGVYSRLTESAMRSMFTFGVEGPNKVNYERMERDLPGLVQFLAGRTHGGKDPALANSARSDFRDVVCPARLCRSKITINDGSHPDCRRTDRSGFIPVEEALYMYRLIPNAEFAITPNAGHFFPKRPRILSSLRCDFLLRREEKTVTGDSN
ncbi:MAG: alpha/beta hydrolase [Caldilineaceae bacterium]